MLYKASFCHQCVQCSKRVGKYKSNLVGVQKIRSDKDGTEPTDSYTFFYEKGNDNHHLGAGFFKYNEIRSTIKRV
jgi:hypothetical protein